MQKRQHRLNRGEVPLHVRQEGLQIVAKENGNYERILFDDGCVVLSMCGCYGGVHDLQRELLGIIPTQSGQLVYLLMPMIRQVAYEKCSDCISYQYARLVCRVLNHYSYRQVKQRSYAYLDVAGSSAMSADFIFSKSL